MLRLNYLDEFYGLLDRLKGKIGGYKYLSTSNGRIQWPKKGVYFFFDNSIVREKSNQLKIIRVGTHDNKVRRNLTTLGTSLWSRLHNHKGNNSLGGNHRGSVFRKLVGYGYINKQGLSNLYSSWGAGQNGTVEQKKIEKTIEIVVSKYIGNLPFLYLNVDGQPEHRNIIERNSIALVSNFGKPIIDPNPGDWLGHFTNKNRIINSGLWNSDFVDNTQIENEFWELLNLYINKTN